MRTSIIKRQTKIKNLISFQNQVMKVCFLLFCFYFSSQKKKKKIVIKQYRTAARSLKELRLLKLVNTWNQSLSQPRLVVLGLFLQVQREHFLCFHLFLIFSAVNSSFIIHNSGAQCCFSGVTSSSHSATHLVRCFGRPPTLHTAILTHWNS